MDHSGRIFARAGLCTDDARAAVILGQGSIIDLPTAVIGLVSLIILWRFKIPELALIAATDPAPEIAPNAMNGLRADGLTLVDQKPQRLSDADLRQAARVISFCELPTKYGHDTPVEQWTDVPPVGEDYQRARDVIIQHLQQLFGQLKGEKNNE